MNDHIRRGLDALEQQQMKDLAVDAPYDRVLGHAIMAFYALRLMYPTIDIYAV